ncbi:hypothetical protein [Paenibacillus planticolens]|uniref:hypothetical protein n=1 Tax=Paenibacillus planticolens TaxID=2654976 RepID=UPI0014922D08|nr:hypothetical protein [Paenibacillus planticolens]
MKLRHLSKIRALMSVNKHIRLDRPQGLSVLSNHLAQPFPTYIPLKEKEYA